MPIARCRKLTWPILLAVIFHSAPAPAEQPASSGTASFVLSGNRIYAEIAFVRADGTLRKTRAFVDSGSPSMLLSPALFKELQLDQRNILTFLIGGMPVSLNSSDVASVEGWFPFPVGSDPQVEALLPAGLMQKYQVVIDYQNRILTFAQPGILKPEGIPVPFQINGKTGLIAVKASIGGHSYPITIDTGSGYTWLRKSIVQGWLRLHPDWQRSVGAVGLSNMRMADDGIEATGVLVRIPEVNLGPLQLHQIGALGIGPSNSNLDFINWYSKKNPLPVLGWFGGNVLQGFRLTIDYPNRVIYWLRQAALDPHELDQVGLTLKQQGAEYFVAAIVTQNGLPTVEGVLPGDKLIQIGELRASSALPGELFSAMHGKSGQVRTLVLERRGQQLTVEVKVTAF